MCVKFSKLVLGAAAGRSPSMSAALAARTYLRAQSNPPAAIFSIPPCDPRTRDSFGRELGGYGGDCRSDRWIVCDSRFAIRRRGPMSKTIFARQSRSYPMHR